MPESNAAERLVQPPGAAPAAGASRLRSTASLKDRLLLQLVGLKIPMLLFVGPRVVGLDEEGCELHRKWGMNEKLIPACYSSTT